jgi:hypothetical protein
MWRRHRSNYCAHPAFLESWGIEQFFGSTEFGEPKNLRDSTICPIDQYSDMEELMASALRDGFWAYAEMGGPTLSPASKLHPHHEEWLRGEWPNESDKPTIK